MLRNVRGLVIGNKPAGDKYNLLTVITETEGVITVRARVSERVTSNMLGAQTVFSYQEMYLHTKGDLNTLTESKQIESFYRLCEDLDSYVFACYVVEFSSRFFIGDADDAQIFALMLNTLHAACKKLRPVRFLKTVFELRLMSIAGTAPLVDSCGLCGNTLDSEKVSRFDISLGCCVCDLCAAKSDNAGRAFLLSAYSIKAIEYIASAPKTKIFSFKLDDSSLDELSVMSEKFIEYHYNLKLHSKGIKSI